MKLEKVNPETVNRLYRATKIQVILDEFLRMDAVAVRCKFDPGEYACISSAQSSYQRAIKRLGYNMSARVVKGNLYLIKIENK